MPWRMPRPRAAAGPVEGGRLAEHDPVVGDARLGASDAGQRQASRDAEQQRRPAVQLISHKHLPSKGLGAGPASN